MRRGDSRLNPFLRRGLRDLYYDIVIQEGMNARKDQAEVVILEKVLVMALIHPDLSLKDDSLMSDELR